MSELCSSSDCCMSVQGRPAVGRLDILSFPAISGQEIALIMKVFFSSAFVSAKAAKPCGAANSSKPRLSFVLRCLRRFNFAAFCRAALPRNRLRAAFFFSGFIVSCALIRYPWCRLGHARPRNCWRPHGPHKGFRSVLLPKAARRASPGRTVRAKVKERSYIHRPLRGHPLY